MKAHCSHFNPEKRSSRCQLKHTASTQRGSCLFPCQQPAPTVTTRQQTHQSVFVKALHLDTDHARHDPSGKAKTRHCFHSAPDSRLDAHQRRSFEQQGRGSPRGPSCDGKRATISRTSMVPWKAAGENSFKVGSTVYQAIATVSTQLDQNDGKGTIQVELTQPRQRNLSGEAEV